MTSYDCVKENSERSPEKSLKGWIQPSFQQLYLNFTSCLNSTGGFENNSTEEIDKCVDKATGVIDKKDCYLIPRAVKQFSLVTETSYTALQSFFRTCYIDSTIINATPTLNYTSFYQCIVSEDTINSKTHVYPFSAFMPHVKTLGFDPN